MKCRIAASVLPSFLHTYRDQPRTKKNTHKEQEAATIIQTSHSINTRIGRRGDHISFFLPCKIGAENSVFLAPLPLMYVSTYNVTSKRLFRAAHSCNLVVIALKIFCPSARATTTPDQGRRRQSTHIRRAEFVPVTDNINRQHQDIPNLVLCIDNKPK